MRRTITRSMIAALAALSLVAVGCGGEKTDAAGTGSAPEAKTNAAVDTAAVKTAAATAAAAPPSATAAADAPTASATVAAALPSGAPSAAPSGAASATAPAATGSAAAGAKTFDCGAKGQKPCPMQGWMKGVMGGASSSGDGEKLASALSYVAARPPPGMGNWVSIANAGAAKAKAGDIDGAKASCKQCHDAYKAKYVATLRDRPF